MREVEAKLMEGSARAEGLRRGRSTVSLCSPACGGRRRRSGVWGRGNSKRTRGSARSGFCSAHACERSRAEALSWPGHAGGEVAAGGSIWGCVAERWKHSARGRRASGALARRVGGARQAGGGRLAQSGGRRGSAVLNSGGGKQGSRHEEGEGDYFAISENFRDLTVNQQ